MPVLHFCNCASLAFGPYFILYKASGLSDISGVASLVITSALYYVLTQIGKILLIVTCVPTVSRSVIYGSQLQEFSKALVNLIDLVGLHHALQSRTSSSFERDARLLGVGLGWAAADTAAQHFVPIFVGTQRPEFIFDHMIRALASNIALAEHLTIVTIVFLFSRRRKPRATIELALQLALHELALPVLLVSFTVPGSAHIRSFMGLFVHFLVVAVSAIYTQWLLRYRAHEKQM